MSVTTEELTERMRDVVDPELGINVVDLGLVYGVHVDDDEIATIDMTLTAPACPVAGEMPGWVKDAVAKVPGIGEVTVNMVFDPPWTPERMSEEARLELNMF